MYQVILTFSEVPSPRRPFQALLIVCTRVSAKLGFFVLFVAEDGRPVPRSGRDVLAVSKPESDRGNRGLETMTDSQPCAS